MKEFLDFLSECKNKYDNCPSCINSCPHNLFCKVNMCPISICDQCMHHIQWALHPSFSYSCKRITYHYVLRFLNRFASEIAYAMANYKFGSIKKYNVVSLGCGPGSEVYGIIGILKAKKLPICLDYQGYDLNDVWEDVQKISGRCLAQMNHQVLFLRQDMFNSFKGFNGESVDLLILNYLLSDVEKFANNIAQKKSFIVNLAEFVIMNGVNNILFNDNSFYGNDGKLNSGVQVMLGLIEELKRWHVTVTTKYRCFPFDMVKGNQPWKSYPKNKLVLPLLQGNNLDSGVRFCNSKQIFVHIN